ncbi:hypothetical protein IV203_003378 [Nitzschia inconspicua]|uniref:Uncharacterized protein n=1 Tax=Nitzschia inconspicua TaxID=303405 RepID=A0A9K3L275_9STRA|nr:hypothetical protein IV203_003378 [Nitzschia inconspicua]
MDSKGSDEKDDDYDEEDDEGESNVDDSSDSIEGKQDGVSPPAKSKLVSNQNNRNDRTMNSRDDKTSEAKIVKKKRIVEPTKEITAQAQDVPPEQLQAVDPEPFYEPPEYDDGISHVTDRVFFPKKPKPKPSKTPDAKIIPITPT